MPDSDESSSSDDENLAALQACVVDFVPKKAGSASLTPRIEHTAKAGGQLEHIDRKESVTRKIGDTAPPDTNSRLVSRADFFGTGSGPSGGDAKLAKQLEELIGKRVAFGEMPPVPSTSKPQEGPRELPWGEYDKDGSGCRLFKKTKRGAPLRLLTHHYAASGVGSGKRPWARAFRPLVPVESPDGSDADDGEFARRCAHAAAGGRVDGGGRRVAVEVTLPAEGVVVRDKRSGDVEMGSPRHGITTGACEKLLGSRIGRL